MSINPNKLSSKHTPGPWSVKSYILDSAIGIIADNGEYNNFDRIVVNTIGRHDTDKKDLNYANAHLISAAPEAIEFIADLMPTFELMKATGLFDTEAVDKVISDAETILKKAYNL